jgi:hypothetical protein
VVDEGLEGLAVKVTEIGLLPEETDLQAIGVYGLWFMVYGSGFRV